MEHSTQTAQECEGHDACRYPTTPNVHKWNVNTLQDTRWISGSPNIRSFQWNTSFGTPLKECDCMSKKHMVYILEHIYTILSISPQWKWRSSTENRMLPKFSRATPTILLVPIHMVENPYPYITVIFMNVLISEGNDVDSNNSIKLRCIL